MKADGDEELNEELNDDGDLVKERDPQRSLSAMEMFAVPEAREEDVRVARGMLFLF